MTAVNLQDWVGRRETRRDHVYPTPVNTLAATLNMPLVPGPGEAISEFWYWLYFLPNAPMREVGSDGHPRRGGFLPPIELERRMWAGGRFAFHGDIRVGDDIEKTSEILSIAEKEGKAGRMVFVTVKHRVTSPRGLAVEEEHDIVYVAMPKVFTPPPPLSPPAALDWNEPYPMDPVLLFRFSALTFNGHRIHYDLKYVTEVENYPGLIVHGPLQAMLLFESAKAHNPGRAPKSFAFRAVRPLFDFDPIAIVGKARGDGGHDLFTVQSAQGYVGMQGTITWR